MATPPGDVRRSTEVSDWLPRPPVRGGGGTLSLARSGLGVRRAQAESRRKPAPDAPRTAGASPGGQRRGRQMRLAGSRRATPETPVPGDPRPF